MVVTAGVATNCCNGPAPVLQRCARVARNCCIKPLQHAFVLQRIDATECCRSIVCCNVCIATHFTVNDATCIDGSYRVLLQQTYTPGWDCVAARVELLYGMLTGFLQFVQSTDFEEDQYGTFR